MLGRMEELKLGGALDFGYKMFSGDPFELKMIYHYLLKKTFAIFDEI